MHPDFNVNCSQLSFNLAHPNSPSFASPVGPQPNEHGGFAAPLSLVAFPDTFAEHYGTLQRQCAWEVSTFSFLSVYWCPISPVHPFLYYPTSPLGRQPAFIPDQDSTNDRLSPRSPAPTWKPILVPPFPDLPQEPLRPLTPKRSPCFQPTLTLKHDKDDTEAILTTTAHHSPLLKNNTFAPMTVTPSVSVDLHRHSKDVCCPEPSATELSKPKPDPEPVPPPLRRTGRKRRRQKRRATVKNPLDVLLEGFPVESKPTLTYLSGKGIFGTVSFDAAPAVKGVHHINKLKNKQLGRIGDGLRGWWNGTQPLSMHIFIRKRLDRSLPESRDAALLKIMEFSRLKLHAVSAK